MTNQLARTGGELSEMMQYAKAMSGSDIIPQAYRHKPANVLVALDFGVSIGLRPAESLYRVNVIGGKPVMSGELMLSRAREAGHKVRIKQDAASMSVTVSLVRKDDPDAPISVTWDMARAKQMGLSGKDNYSKQPLTMLTWRAVSEAVRIGAPECTHGAYIPEEMESVEQAAPKPAEVVSAEPVRDDPTDYMQPVRDIYAEFRDTCHADVPTEEGARNVTAMTDILTVTGAESMDALTEEQAKRAVRYMSNAIAATHAAEGAER